MQNKTIALTGVTGHLGAAVLQELHARRYQVHTLVRTDDLRACTGIPVKVFKGDILESETLVPLMQGCDAVIHCGGVISIDGDPDGIVYRTNVVGTHNVLDAAVACQVKRVIHISSIHAFQQTPVYQVLDEHSPLVGEMATAYDRSKRDGQQLALSFNTPQTEVIAICPTGLIGPYDFKPSRTGRAIQALLKRRMPFVINAGFDFCDTRDVAHGIVNALAMGTPGETYLMAGKWHGMKDIASTLASVSGRRIPVVSLPVGFAKAGLPFARIWSAASRTGLIYTKEALDALLYGNTKIDSTKAQRELNYHARPLEQTLRDTWMWFEELRV